MNKCTNCHKNPITRYVGLQLCNPCYYHIRPILASESLSGIVCPQCHERPAFYKHSHLCRACYAINQYHRDLKAEKIKRDAWKATKPPEWRAARAAAERERRAKQGDAYRAKERERHQRNREKRLARQRQYYIEHASHLRKHQSDFRKAHRDWSNEVKRKRRNQNMGVPVTLTKQEWQDILLRFNHCCAYCGKYFEHLTQDHAIPLSRGGGYTADNIVPACQSCNSRKHNKTAQEFIASIKTGKDMSNGIL